ncbi:MAG: hypothetical protein MR874_00825 [Coriobacteriaceae bacterium]|nr:hypothetical protein [Coriobacteriaceae bacterium]
MARRAAWGSVEEMVRGKKYRLRYWASTPEGYRRVSEIVYGTRADAEDVRAQRRLDHGRERATPTVSAAYERWWLPNFERRVAEGEAASACVSVPRGAPGLGGGSRGSWAACGLPGVVGRPVHVHL